MYHLPQSINELTNSLPHYPKDIPIIVVSMKGKGKGNTFKDVTVRRNKVEDALQWLSLHNPLYKDIKINQDSLNSLPQNGIPSDLQTIQTTSDTLNKETDHSFSTGNELDHDSDIVFNNSTETRVFFPSKLMKNWKQKQFKIKQV